MYRRIEKTDIIRRQRGSDDERAVHVPVVLLLDVRGHVDGVFGLVRVHVREVESAGGSQHARRRPRLHSDGSEVGVLIRHRIARQHVGVVRLLCLDARDGVQVAEFGVVFAQRDPREVRVGQIAVHGLGYADHVLLQRTVDVRARIVRGVEQRHIVHGVRRVVDSKLNLRGRVARIVRFDGHVDVALRRVHASDGRARHVALQVRGEVGHVGVQVQVFRQIDPRIVVARVGCIVHHICERVVDVRPRLCDRSRGEHRGAERFVLFEIIIFQR